MFMHVKAYGRLRDGSLRDPVQLVDKKIGIIYAIISKAYYERGERVRERLCIFCSNC
jgi:hypothetical protein